MVVLLTRAVDQTRSGYERVERLGDTVVTLPTIVIEDVADQQTLRATLLQLLQYDMAIFISPNAVRKTAAIIRQWPAQTKIIAVGSSTAKAIKDLHWPEALLPKTEFNTEGLLALPDLQQVNGKRIMLLRGEGGRELLAATLRERGAHVTEAIVYRRTLPQVKTLPDLQSMDVIVSTSNTSLQNLCDLYSRRKELFNKQLLVSSKRIADFAVTLGFVKTPLIADNASDEAIVDKLFLLRSSYGRTERCSSTI